MRAKLRLRPYRNEDFETAIEIWMHAWQTSMPEIAFAKRVEWWRARWEHDLVPNNSITIAEAGGNSVGFVVIDPNTGWLDQLAVHPSHWGNGIAKALLEEAKRVSPSLIRLDVNQTNVRAISLYERLGFVRTGEGVNRNSGAPTFLYEWTPQTATAPNCSSARRA
jgi:putative acetyltransferase